MKSSSTPSKVKSPIPPLTVQQREVLWSSAWVLVLCGIAFFKGLASAGLVDETEPLFAEAARQMYETGDWVTPYFNGVPRFDKPPLVYWLMAMGFHLFGVGEWAVRLPSALSGAALVGLGFYTLRRFGFPRPERAIATSNAPLAQQGRASLPQQQILRWSAVVGSAAMALHPETLVWGRIGVSDMLLSGCIGTALFSFFLGYAQPQFPKRQRGWFLAFYALMGLAVLAKGPIGLVLPGAIVVSFLVYTGQLGATLRECSLVKGAMLFLIITVPWYVLVIAANGRAYIDSFFGYHNVDRFTSVVNGHAAPWYFYFIVVAVGFLPWSPFLPFAIARLSPWRRRRWRKESRASHLGLFALVWFWVVFGFFTLAVTKLPSYVLPLMPAAAILVGLAWGERTSPQRSPQSGADAGFWVSYGVNLLTFAVLLGAALYSPNWMGNDPAMPGLPDLVRESGVMVRAAVIWGGAIAAGLLLLWMRQARWLWSVNLVAFAAFLMVSILPAYRLADQVRQLPLRHIAEVAVTEQRTGETLYMTGFMKPSLVFYTQQPVQYVEAIDELRQHLKDATTSSALVVGKRDELRSLNWPASQQTTLLDAETYQLVRITR